GEATPEQLAVLGADRPAWRAALLRLVSDAEEHLHADRSLCGDERDQVVADAEADHRRLAAALARFTAAERGADPYDGSDRRPRERDEQALAPGVCRLQVSWEPGWVVAWGGGPRTRTADDEGLTALLAAADAPTSGWIR